jgi:NADH:ubiquinone oxidoreductase subunit F (NADH-binding)
VNGLAALAATLHAILNGVNEGNTATRIDRLASLTSRRGACGHPDGAVSFILSAVRIFAEEFSDHARHGPCDACAQPGELPIPVAAHADRGSHEPVPTA